MMGVATVMSTDVVTVPPHRSVVEAARAMVSARTHHLVVTERDLVVGVVSSYDVMMLLAGRVEQAARPAMAPGHGPGLHAQVGDLDHVSRQCAVIARDLSCDEQTALTTVEIRHDLSSHRKFGALEVVENHTIPEIATL